MTHVDARGMASHHFPASSDRPRAAIVATLAAGDARASPRVAGVRGSEMRAASGPTPPGNGPSLRGVTGRTVNAGERRRYSRKGRRRTPGQQRGEAEMTTFIARHGDRTADPSAAFRTGKQR